MKKLLIVLVIFLLGILSTCTAEECTLTDIPWHRMNGAYEETESGIILHDSTTNRAGQSYVYYDTEKSGDISFLVHYDRLELSERSEFVLRIEGKTDDSQAIELFMQSGKIIFRTYEGTRKAAYEVSRNITETSGCLSLTFHAESGLAEGKWNDQMIGNWKMNDFILPHRIRIHLNDKSNIAESAVELTQMYLQYSTQEVTPVRIPAVLTLENAQFHLELDTERHGLTLLKRVNDVYDTNYVRTEDPDLLGNISLRYARPEHEAAGEYREILSRHCKVDYEWTDSEIRLIYRDMLSRDISLMETWKLEGEELLWEMIVTNTSSDDLRIKDWELPFAFNQAYVKDTTTTYTQRLVRHSFCSLDGSFAYWTRPNGVGPMLTMVPAAGTALEYYDTDWSKLTAGWSGPYSMFIHSEIAGGSVDGDWMLPHTGLTLAPKEAKRYALRFAWADDEKDVRNTIVELGGVDVTVLPGMTVTKEMPVKMALRSHETIHSIQPINGASVNFIGEKDGYLLYDVAFSQIGENQLEVHFGENRRMMLDFFVTKPLDELIQSRANHMAHHQQYRGDAWYDGLFSQWDMKTQQLLTPDNNLEGLAPYIVGGSDDPGLCKAPFLAVKNASYPVREEIEAIEYYIENFLWGGQQRTDEELPRPYAIYGSEFWYVQRNSGTGFNNGGHGEDKMWRTFDYTHICQLYYYMYRIAKMYPDMVTYLDADGYLERAYRTAMAFYEIPISIFMDNRWDFQGYCDWAYTQGNFHEIIIPKIIDALEAEERSDDAQTLRAEWEMKVKYMVYDHPYPFGSEMWFDSTAFESTHVVAKYGLEHDVPADETGYYAPNKNGPGQAGYLTPHTEVTKEDFQAFMEKELIANKAARATIEPAYYLLGSDYRQWGNTNYLLSYMTQLGGWSLMDAALYYSDNAAEDMRLAYACYLAGWSLINTGEDYPWYPAAGNEGAAGWAFEPSKEGYLWIGTRFFDQWGPWRMDGEIDNGFIGGLRSAASVLVNDPLFGLYLYGGTVEQTEEGLTLLPADGLQQRLHLLHTASPVHLQVNRDGILSAVVAENEIILTMENRSADAHELVIEMEACGQREELVYPVTDTAQYHLHIPLK